MSGRLSVVIVEDERDVREGLAALIDDAEGFRCPKSCRTMEEALAWLADHQPDLLMTDLRLPGMSGIEGIRHIRDRHASMPIVALTLCDNDGSVFNALCAGASGYLLKNTTPERLLESLKEAATGGAPMSPEVARRVVAIFRQFRPPEQASYRLTPQENELLRLMVDGHHKKTAADVLGISVNTVSFHLKNIYGKLQVHSKTEAVAKALRERLL
jgi:DNA-binding NarL/FixJ family response regulator